MIHAPEQTSGPLAPARGKISKWVVFVPALLCTIAVYELPYILTLAKTGWTALPPVLVSDQMLYLNLSNIHHASATEVVNPWYGNLVRAMDVPHLMFPITFVLFRFTHAIFGSWTAAMLVWAAFWTALSFAAAVFCLDSLFPGSDRRLATIGAVALLLLHSPLIYLAEIKQLPSLLGILQMQLPYLRFAFPQVIVPLVLAYWGLQVRALKNPSTLALAGLALLQFAVCAAFPYVLPLLAIGTGITVLIATHGKSENALSWQTALAYAAVCGVLDIGYVLIAGLPGSHGNVQFRLQFRSEMILPALRPYVLLLVAASALALFSRASLAARATVAGLALSSALLGLSNVFFAPEAQMLNHPDYIIGITTWLPLFVYLRDLVEKFDRRRLCIGFASGLALLGVWEGFASYQSAISANLFQTAAADELRELGLTSKDLVVAPARVSDDVSCWVPLVSPAQVLYTPDGENILSADDTRTQQTFRQAVYLMMGGMNLASLTAITDPRGSEVRFAAWSAFLAQQGDRTFERSPLSEDRRRLRSTLRERLGPVLAQLGADPASAGRLFAGHDRIIVIDGSAHPFFIPAAFSRWFDIQKSYERNGVKVWICRYRLGS